MKQFIKNLLILSITLLIIFIIFSSIFLQKKEGFSIKDIDNVVDDVKKVTKVIGDIPDEIKNITNKVNDMGKIIEKNLLDVLTKKIGSIFTQIGDILNEGLVEPVTAVFIGIGDVFLAIFGILGAIGEKIVSLPGCMFVYMIQEVINVCKFFYRKLVPTGLKNIFSVIYRYTFKYIFDFIGRITGYNASVQRCYGFNVSSEVDNIKSSFSKIGDTFKKDFGRLNFGKIKI
jgi:hypothetical protein